MKGQIDPHNAPRVPPHPRSEQRRIAPADLIAYPGRGSALVFELDANGERIPDPQSDSTFR